jgi:DedD protein
MRSTVSDATHDFADDGFHEIHLSGKQLVFLFMATTVIAVVVFLCGVLVGRGVRTRQAQDPLLDPAATAAAATTPVATTAPVADAGPQAAEPPAPPAESDELSYKKRLEGDAPAAESLKPAPQPQPQAPARPVAAPAPPPPAPVVAASTQAAAGAPQPGTWIVQVHALRDRSVANGIVQRLRAKDYPAFLVPAGPPTGTYKVQVGKYRDRDEALRVIERLKKEEQFNPWITR